MKLLGQVGIVNRLAHSNGFGANSKLGRVCKGVLQIRNRQDGNQVLLISTVKEVAAHEYDVTSIEKLRTQFVKDGLATIEIRQPPMNVMLRKCNPEELQNFINVLEKLWKEKDASGTSGTTSKKGTDDKEKPGTLRKSAPVKRTRSPELSKTATAKIKKCLDNSETVISVRNRDKYPKEFLKTIQHITIRGIRLRKIDSRMLRLQWLIYLDLSGNCIGEVKELANLNCGGLKVLKLAQNEIRNLPDGFFKRDSLRGLLHLDLSKNKLTKMPSSFVYLTQLNEANLSSNQIQCLPYNLMDMRNLRTLNISENKLSFIPAPITKLSLLGLDMSNNPDLHTTRDKSADYVGYSTLPTLFETSCEVVMNMQRKKRRLHEDEFFPSVTQSYLHGGKYCMECGTLTLRFKIVKDFVTASSLCQGSMSACSVSPALTLCLIKKIVCLHCDNTLPESRLSKIV